MLSLILSRSTIERYVEWPSGPQAKRYVFVVRQDVSSSFPSATAAEHHWFGLRSSVHANPVAFSFACRRRLPLIAHAIDAHNVNEFTVGVIQNIFLLIEIFFPIKQLLANNSSPYQSLTFRILQLFWFPIFAHSLVSFLYLSLHQIIRVPLFIGKLEGVAGGKFDCFRFFFFDPAQGLNVVSECGESE
jgi:hypothetical protein